jgi:hypothetical protein
MMCLNLRTVTLLSMSPILCLRRRLSLMMDGGSCFRGCRVSICWVRLLNLSICRMWLLNLSICRVRARLGSNGSRLKPTFAQLL